MSRFVILAAGPWMSFCCRAFDKNGQESQRKDGSAEAEGLVLDRLPLIQQQAGFTR
jgi:hypothetical protein